MPRKKGKGNDDVEFWTLLERQYVQGNESARALAKRYKKPTSTVASQATARKWKEKRAKYRAYVADTARRKAELAEVEIEAAAHRRRDVYQGYVEGQLHELAWRSANMAKDLREKLENGIVKVDPVTGKKTVEIFLDSPAALQQAIQNVTAITALGRYVYPDLGPPEPPAPIYEAIISEQKTTHRLIKTIPNPDDDAIIIEVTAEEAQRRAEIRIRQEAP